MTTLGRGKRPRSVFRCQSCGHVETKWLGRCPGCQEWNCLVEEQSEQKPQRAARGSAKAGAPVSVAAVEQMPDEARLTCGLGELDRVLGGGLVPGSLVLLGGDPGVGKSTLLVHMLHGIAARAGDKKVLYVSGEESVSQTALRARRVGAVHQNLTLLAETRLERILDQAKRLGPVVLACDSIQTLHTDALDSIPGSVGQVRECAGRLLTYAKTSDVPTVLVGHVTKDGSIAGPKTLEHVVDAVLHFEGEGAGPYRLLRAIKNRFGSTQELGVFEMRTGGLWEVENPSELFLAERPVGAPGSVVVASADGSRPLLVEIQALVAPPSAGVGRRTAAGVDAKRVALLLAVLAQRASCDVLNQDVFVNVAGGVRLTEPAVDLGIAIAVASSARGRALHAKTVVFGEVGLAGEVRGVNMADIRLAEAAKLGFTRCVLPAQNAARVESSHGIELVGVRRLAQALEQM